jgi:hypothetical protein
MRIHAIKLAPDLLWRSRMIKDRTDGRDLDEKSGALMTEAMEGGRG